MQVRLLVRHVEPPRRQTIPTKLKIEASTFSTIEALRETSCETPIAIIVEALLDGNNGLVDAHRAHPGLFIVRWGHVRGSRRSSLINGGQARRHQEHGVIGSELFGGRLHGRTQKARNSANDGSVTQTT